MRKIVSVIDHKSLILCDIDLLTNNLDVPYTIISVES